MDSKFSQPHLILSSRILAKKYFLGPWQLGGKFATSFGMALPTGNQQPGSTKSWFLFFHFRPILKNCFGVKPFNTEKMATTWSQYKWGGPFFQPATQRPQIGCKIDCLLVFGKRQKLNLEICYFLSWPSLAHFKGKVWLAHKIEIAQNLRYWEDSLFFHHLRAFLAIFLAISPNFSLIFHHFVWEFVPFLGSLWPFLGHFDLFYAILLIGT